MSFCPGTADTSKKYDIIPNNPRARGANISDFKIFVNILKIICDSKIII